MNLVDLILTVCLTASPDSCRTEHVYFEDRGSLVQCMFHASIYIAPWSQENPNLKVVRWKCAYRDNGEDI